MKSVWIIAAACLLFFSGCRKPQEKNIQNIPPAVDHDSKSETAQQPYYYGLIEEYRTILAEDPNNTAAVIGLGNAYFDSGAWRDAIQQYEIALKRDARNADVRTDLGTAYRNLGMTNRALDEYRLTLQYEPGHLNARYNMGIIYAYDFRDYAVAVHVWEALLRLAPNYPQAAHMRTCIMTFKKNLKKDRP